MAHEKRSISRSSCLRWLARVVLAGGALAPLASGCGDENAVVGGACAPGYVECDGRCVPGTSCGDGGSSGDGGGGRDGSTEGGALTDARAGDGAGGDDGSTDGCPPPPYVTAAACGACNVQCSAPNDTCRLDGTGAFTCQPPCTPPLVACNGVCLDVSNDPANCGACGKICPSNLCVANVCQGATPGDIVVIGADYRQTLAGSAQARLLTNAALVPTSNPLRVLTYEKYADAAAVLRVKQLITGAAIGRTTAYTPTTNPADLASATLAARFDVVLVADQESGDAASLATEGASWAAALATFTKAGGVVIALDGAAGQGNMPTLVTSAGLLAMSGHTALTPGSRVLVLAPSDTVGANVPSPFGTFFRAASLTTSEPSGGDVVYVAAVDLNPGVGAPMVVHKIVR